MQPFEARASDKLEVKFLGVARWDDRNTWWAIDGAKIDDPRGPFADLNPRAGEGVTHQLVLLVTGPAAGGYAVQVNGERCPLYDLTPSDEEAYLLIPFGAAKEAKHVDVEVFLADGEWETLCTSEHEPGRALESHTTDRGGVAFTHISETPEGDALVYVAHDLPPERGQFDVYATDQQGNERRCVNIRGGRVGSFTAMNLVFDLPPEQITSVAAKVRPFNKQVTAKQVALEPSRPTKPQIEVKEIERKQ
jgi:hypothetical protein